MHINIFGSSTTKMDDLSQSGIVKDAFATLGAEMHDTSLDLTDGKDK